MSSNREELVKKLVENAEMVGNLKICIKIAENNPKKDDLDDYVLIPSLKSILHIAEMVVKETSQKLINSI